MNISAPPLVSIIMPVCNAEHYIDQTLRSIRKQTYQHFEVIMVDDKSTDNTPNILKKITEDDNRFRLITNRKQVGVAQALNLCMQHAQGKYIARMDADDVMLSSRIEEQLAFMEAHPEIGILGTAAYHISPANKIITAKRQLTEDSAIRFQLLFFPPFYHPSCMYRAAIIRDNHLAYPADVKTAEDMVFWREMLQHCKAGNLTRPLLYYRKHPGSISHRLHALQTKEKIALSEAYIKKEFENGVKEIDIVDLLNLLHNGNLNKKMGILRPLNSMTKFISLFLKKNADASPFMLKAIACKWLLKTALNSNANSARKACNISLLLARIDYSLPFVMHLLSSGLWLSKAMFFNINRTGCHD